jgi:hypothetical protein
MKIIGRAIIGLFILVTGFLVVTSSVFAQVNPFENVEHIDRYEVLINVQKDGTLSFTEKIQYDFANVDRHGIKRWIPLRFQDGEKEYEMELTNVQILMDGGSKVPVDFSSSEGIREIKIGDPNKTITGKHTYEIRYMIAGGMRYFDDHDELYWNAIGQDWQVPILESAVHIEYPQEVNRELIEAQCFTGVIGSTEQNCQTFANQGRVDISSSNILSPGVGMTIVVGLPTGSVARLLPKEYIPFSKTPLGKLLITIGMIVAIIGAIAWYIVYPIWIVVRWFLYGRDPDVGIDVTAYFEGPKVGKGHLSPAETGGLIDEKVDRRDIVAALVDLARRGYVKIEEREKKDFYLYRLHEQRKNDRLQDFEDDILSAMFAAGDEVRLKDVKNITTELSVIEKKIYQRLMDDAFFVKNPKKVRDFYGVISGIAMMTFNFQLLLVSALFGNAMPRKTLKGARAAQQARGLQNFLTSQERQMNYQGNMQMLFEKLLPYAVAFGVEKHWIQRFADLGVEIVQPVWYVGQSHFASSFSDFNSAARTSSYTQTTSSYSSSGFSGGSSGGGGGGGGGGSW